MATPKFTFKTIKDTGKWSSFYPKSHEILHNKIKIGNIDDDTYKIRLKVKKEPTKDDPAPFKWITLKKDSSSLDEAKEFLNKNITVILERYDLFYKQ